MESTRRLAAVLLFALACPVIAQEEESSVFFTLSTDRTYSPSEKPVVRLWGQGFRALQFRLYRVNDPVAFFEKLKDDHQFGGEAPRPDSTVLTPLEKFRAWKRGMRAGVRNLMRAQFTIDSRIRYREFRAGGDSGARQSARPAPQEYAQVPVLNPQQLVSTWEQSFARDSAWASESIHVPAPGKGLYLLEATNGKIQAYTIVSVTEVAIVTKGAPGKLLTRVVRRDTGAPAKDCPVHVYGAARKKIAGGNTDSDGLFAANVSETSTDSLLILARTKDDFAAVTMWGSAVSSHDRRHMSGYVYTDRPVYRPGHTVYYRAILRAKTAAGYDVPKGEATVEVQDNEGKSIFKNKHTLSANGTLNGQFTVPASAGLGYYNIDVNLGGAASNGGFQVEEYRKPEYEVKVTPSQRRAVQGATVPVTLEARYFYGEPVAGAKLTWVVHKQRYWSYFRDDMESGEGDNDDSPWASREQVSEESGELGADGKLTVNVPTAVDDNDMRYRVEARVTDAAGREIAGAAFVLATVADYWLQVETDKYVYSPGDQARVTVTARDYDNKPVSGVNFEVDFSEYSTGRETRRIAGGSGVTGVDGKGTISVLAEGGWLRGTVRSRTPNGRVVTDYTYLWVAGGAFDWSRGEQRLQLVPDKKSYKPGEVAHVLVVAQPGAHLWITTEGRAIHESKFVTAKQSTTVDIPIQREHVPNFYVTAVAVVKDQVLQGTKSLKVPPVEKTLAVALTPSKPEFKPGEPASYTLEAKDSAGRPVAGEFSVGVVDEALYAVRPDQTPDIVNHFYGREYNAISTETSMRYYFHGQAGKRRMQLARVRPLHARAQLKPESLVQPKVRKAFPDTAYWSALVNTDASGRAQVRFEFPDALTTWRTTARGVTADTKVGSVINRVIVRKNLLIRLSTPRFFRQGDTMTVSAIAQNFLAKEKQVRVSLEAKGIDIVEGATRDIAVPNKGTATVDYKVQVPGPGQAVLLAKALTDEESDALELTIPVIPFGTRMGISRGGSFGGGQSQAESEISFPRDAEPGSQSIEVTASPSVAGSMFDALDYLTAFPYGCTEQTMSSFLPNVIVSQAVKSLNLNSKVDEKELAKKVRAGLDRLYDFQHEDGGWGWWKTDDSHIFMTAYVLSGLSQARAAGRDVDSDRLERAAAWLEAAQVGRQSLDLQAYVAYALALAGVRDAQRLQGLYDRRSEMDGYAMALFGLALADSGDKRSKEIAVALEKKAETSETEAWWKVEHDYLLDIVTDSSPEATAQALKLLTRENPQSALLPKAALYLVNHKSEGRYWGSTKQTAMVIHGLTDYLKQSGELKPNSTVTVFVNDKQVSAKKFSEADGLAPLTIVLRSVDLAPGANKVRVVRNGQGRAYWSASGAYFSNAPKPSNRGDQRLDVRREYYRLVSTDRGGKIVYDLRPLDGPVAQGDLLAVRLRVDGGTWRYLMIEDPIPAGSEIMERDDLYELRSKPDWWRYWFTRREFRDDRAVFFQTLFDGGSSEYTYILKIVNPGTFRVSPARVEPMYQPRYFATSEVGRVEVKERAQ